MSCYRTMILGAAACICGCAQTPVEMSPTSPPQPTQHVAPPTPKPTPAVAAPKARPPKARTPEATTEPVHYEAAFEALAKKLAALLAEEGAPKRIAVYSFQESRKDKLTPLGEFIASMLPVYLQDACPPDVTLVERRKMSVAIEEIAKGQGATFKEDTVVEAGKFAGAQVAVVGDVFPSTRHYEVIATFMAVEKAVSLSGGRARVKVARTEDFEGIVGGGEPPKVSALFRHEENATIDPSAIPAEKYIQLGDYVYDRGEYALAMEQYRKALAKTKTAKLLYRMGVIEYETNQDFRKALDYFDEVRKLEPKKANVHYAIALCYFQKGNVDVSMSAARAALALHPGHYDARKVLGLGLVEKGQYADALKEYARARQDAPHDSEIPYNQACAYCRMGQSDRALDYLAKAVDLGFDKTAHVQADPDLEPIRYHLRFQSLIQRMTR